VIVILACAEPTFWICSADHHPLPGRASVPAIAALAIARMATKVKTMLKENFFTGTSSGNGNVKM
jgi:hypothetical protein